MSKLNRVQDKIRRALELHLQSPDRAGSDRRRMLMAARDLANEAARDIGNARDSASTLMWARAISVVGVATRDLGDPDLALIHLAAAASVFLQRAGAAQDEELALTAFDMSYCYHALGLPNQASWFSSEAMKRLPPAASDVGWTFWWIGTLLMAGRLDHARRLIGDRDPSSAPQPNASYVKIYQHLAGVRQCSPEELAAAYARLGIPSRELTSLCCAAVVTSLLRSGANRSAAEIVQQTRGALLSQGCDQWTYARLTQLLAYTHLQCGEYRLALDEGAAAWAASEDLRYRCGTARLRAAVYDSYSLARYCALSAAVRVEPSATAELVEACRTQSTVDMWGSAVEFDAALRGRPSPPSKDAGSLRNVDLTRLTPPFSFVIDDCWNWRSELGTPADLSFVGQSILSRARAAVAAQTGFEFTPRPCLDADQLLSSFTSQEYTWWASWFERGTLFWSTRRSSGHVAAGEIAPHQEPDLAKAMTTCMLGNGLKPPWPTSDEEDSDLKTKLQSSDSTDEVLFTGTLSRLIPEPLRTAAREQPVAELLISIAPELSVVPVPVLFLDETFATRLIERFNPRYLPSLAVLARAAAGRSTRGPSAASASHRPLLLSCDHYENDPYPAPPRHAGTLLGPHGESNRNPRAQPARIETLTGVLRSMRAGEQGIAFFRTHYQWETGDPTRCGLVLEDGIFEAGWLVATDRESRQPILAMPSHVVLSCCSTGGRERYGGDALGIVGAALRLGAESVIATSVDIDHTSFTNAFDDMLIELCAQSDDVFSGFAELQRRLLNEWRVYSARGRHTSDDLGREPTPAIWAYYQPYGFGTRNQP